MKDFNPCASCISRISLVDIDTVIPCEKCTKAIFQMIDPSIWSDYYDQFGFFTLQ